MFASINLKFSYSIGYVGFIFKHSFIQSLQNKLPHTSHSYGLHIISKHIEHFIKASIILFFLCLLFNFEIYCF